jgi:exonuclease III
VDRHVISFHGYNDERYRSLIDHAVASPEIAPRVKSVEVFHDAWTQVASDHYPVLLHLDVSVGK